MNNTQAQIQLENEGLAFSLAGSDDGGLLLEDGNIIYLIFEYFTLEEATTVCGHKY